VRTKDACSFPHASPARSLHHYNGATRSSQASPTQSKAVPTHPLAGIQLERGGVWGETPTIAAAPPPPAPPLPAQPRAQPGSNCPPSPPGRPLVRRRRARGRRVAAVPVEARRRLRSPPPAGCRHARSVGCRHARPAGSRPPTGVSPSTDRRRPPPAPSDPPPSVPSAPPSTVQLSLRPPARSPSPSGHPLHPGAARPPRRAGVVRWNRIAAGRLTGPESTRINLGPSSIADPAELDPVDPVSRQRTARARITVPSPDFCFIIACLICVSCNPIWSIAASKRADCQCRPRGGCATDMGAPACGWGPVVAGGLARRELHLRPAASSLSLPPPCRHVRRLSHTRHPPCPRTFRTFFSSFFGGPHGTHAHFARGESPLSFSVFLSPTQT